MAAEVDVWRWRSCMRKEMWWGVVLKSIVDREDKGLGLAGQQVVVQLIVDREDKGLGLAGQRVVARGWVKSRKDIPEHEATAATTTTPHPPQAEDVSCYEVFFHRVPILRPLAIILIGKLIPRPTANEKDGPSAACLHINDGSCSANLQVVTDSSMSLPAQVITVGASILVEGVLQKVLTPKRYVVQLKVEKILHVGIVDMKKYPLVVDTKKYPLAKPKFSLEFLRSHPYLRPRSITKRIWTLVGRPSTHWKTMKWGQNPKAYLLELGSNH
ncbi:hypothetical protein Cni_G16848 [Canna indica]|uniref:Uncharacterized protein n=1 Tax=Canna indica TaxID=4628 RepID=A0AAQ3KLN3_9LILI|nr:hypothetical protein Cni_G16848 [Canna indica]